MVAKINIGNSLYGALAYNAEKVANDEATVLSANKIFASTDGTFDMTACLRDFENYMPDHCRTEKPIIHISLNPHPDDKLTNEQLTEIAHEYMKRLGYGDKPYIVYKHEDIDRHHLHIVSLRVDEQGRKINDKFEHRRSKEITRDLELKYGLLPAERKERNEERRLKKVDPSRGNIKRQIGNIVRYTTSRYRCMSFSEYRALLSIYNIEAEEVKGEIKGKLYNGVVYSATDDKGNKVGNPFKSSLFGKSVGYETLQKQFANSADQIKEKKLASQTKRRITEALRDSNDKAEFRKELQSRGVDVVFRENDAGRLYGVTYVDHVNGCVFNGSRLGKDLSANALIDRFANQHPVHSGVPQQESTNSTEQSHNTGDDSSTLGGLFNLPIETHGTDHEEESFRKRMQRKKKKGRRI